MGEKIPQEARVFALIDVYDALRSNRPYKSALTHDEASDIILSESGKHFDPAIVRVFADVPANVWNEISAAAPTVSLFHDALDVISQFGLPPVASRKRRKNLNHDTVLDSQIVTARPGPPERVQNVDGPST
jgi:hypothetical protein